MLAQTVLPFKLEATDETLTAQGGLALFGEYCQGLGLARWLDEDLPAPGSGAGYAPSAYGLPLVVMLHGGGRSLGIPASCVATRDSRRYCSGR